MSTPKTLLGKRVRKSPPSIVPIGAGLNDEREECFCLLIADGVAVALAYRTAGFTAKGKGALVLYGSQHIQDRVKAILRARAASPAVSLPEVTDMLKRVYAGALHSQEWTPAHNAAFSLARLYGLVVDRAQVDVIRRPSREPDAPAEQALSSWIEALPGPVSTGLEGLSTGLEGPLRGAPAAPDIQGPGLLIEATSLGNDLDGPSGPRVPHVNVHMDAGPGPGAKARGETGNGAPSGPVTGTPTPCGHSENVAELDEGTGLPAWESTGTFPRPEDLF